MKKEVLIQELQELESKIRMYERSGSANADAAKMDVERFQYQYKVKTIDLSDEDRKELAQMAEDKNIKLDHLFELAFTEEEKEEYEESQSFWGKPMTKDFPDLNKQLDEEAGKQSKEDEKEVSKTKKQGFHLFGRKK